MNWFQKIASVSFVLEQSDRIAQPKTISDIARLLDIWAQENAPRYLLPYSVSIDMDGLEPNNSTGIINWYVTEEHSDEVPMYINQWIREEMAPLGFNIVIKGLERSRMWSDRLVYRIAVLKNPTLEYPRIPQMNITNRNATVLLEMLGVPTDDLTGSMDLEEIKRRLLSVNDNKLEHFTLPSTVRRNQLDMGLSVEQISGYIQSLLKMVNFGLQNGFRKIQWY